MVAWLVGVAAVLTLGLIGFAGSVVFVILRERGRRSLIRRIDFCGDPDIEGLDTFVEPAALDFVQIWLDNEWNQKFG